MSDAATSAMLSDVAAYYASKLEAHGPTPQGVDWSLSTGLRLIDIDGARKYQTASRPGRSLLDGNRLTATTVSFSDRGVEMNMTEIDPVRIDRELNSSGYLIIHDTEIEQTSLRARSEYDRCLRASKLHATREKFHYSALAHEPWRKLAIGSSNGLGDPYAQNLQSIYFDAGDTNYPALGSLFGQMILVRNKLMGVDPAFGSDPERDRFWNACRVHHYPRGGGFMATHRDTHFPQVIGAQIGKPFYQVCVLLSRKNTDFFSGGGVIYNGNKERIDLEAQGGFGSLILFDGRTHHGVEDVDLDQVIDFSRTDGRLAAFVNLYSVT